MAHKHSFDHSRTSAHATTPGQPTLLTRTKRSRSKSDDTVSQATEVEGKGSSSRTKKKKKKRSRNKDQLACPFCVYAPGLWASIDACGNWRNDDIATVIRHHVLGKHQDLNEGFASADPRRIDPARFAELKRWRESARLEKKKAADFWVTTYMILFNIDKSERGSVPSPYFSFDLASDAVNKINSHLRHRALDDQKFIDSEPYQMFTKTETRRIQRDHEKSYLREYFNSQIKLIKEIRDSELRRADERCVEDLASLQKSFLSELTAPPQPVNRADLTFMGGAHSQTYPVPRVLDAPHVGEDAQMSSSSTIQHTPNTTQSAGPEHSWLNFSLSSDLRERRYGRQHSSMDGDTVCGSDAIIMCAPELMMREEGHENAYFHPHSLWENWHNGVTEGKGKGKEKGGN